jgi:hypothetical protein
MILKMTLPKDLAEELGESVEQVPTHLGDIALSLITVNPSLTIVTTSLFSAEAFRVALHHWLRRNKERVRFSGEFGRNKLSIDCDERAAAEMADELAEVVAKFLATHPDRAAPPTSIKP